MARLDDAKSALRAIMSHADLLIHACTENGGRIPVDSESGAALPSLRQHRLTFELEDDFQSAQVSRVVSDLLHHITRSYRRQLSCAAASGLVQELEGIVEGYRMAWYKHNSPDLRLRESEAQETVAALIDMLREITQRFVRYIHTEFSYVSDLEQRIHENRRALREAEDLNRLFDTISPSYLENQAGPIPGLQHLLVKVLRHNIGRLRQDLGSATHLLRENLAKLEKDEEALRYGSLIDAFLQHYDRNPGYQPDPGLLEAGIHTPPAFCRVESMELRAEPDVYDQAQHDEMRALLGSALKRTEKTSRPEEEVSRRTPVRVRDCRQSTLAVEPDQFSIAIRHFFSALPQLTAQQGRVSAVEAHRILKVPKPMDVWLMGVYYHHIDGFNGRNPPYYCDLDEKQEPYCTGNHQVRDVTFLPKEGA